MQNLHNAEYRQGDEGQVVRLFEKVFRKQMDPKGGSLGHWHWEFLGRPEQDVLIRLAWDGYRLVGQYAAGPIRLWVNGQEKRAALSYDTMTDPEYQGRGIFTSLASSLIADMQGKGYHSIFGFPNGNSIHGFMKKLGWRRIGVPPVCIRPVSLSHILHAQLRVPARLADWISCFFTGLIQLFGNGRIRAASSKYRIIEESAFGDWADHLWDRCKDQHQVWVVRDRAYLNWRYIEKPYNSYRIISARQGEHVAGFAVVCQSDKHAGSSMFIMDLLVDEAEAAYALLGQILADAKSRRDTLICAMIPRHSMLHRIFRRCGFLRLPEKLFPQELHFAGRLLGNDAVDDAFYDANAWGLSWGDDDVL